MGKAQTRSRSLEWLIGVFIFGLFCLNAALLFQNRALKRDLRAGGPSLKPPIGSTVREVAGLDLAGRPVTILPSAGKSTVLFVFSPGCGICDQLWPKWERLLPEVDSRRFTSVFASSGPGLTASFVAEHGIGNYPILREIDPATVVALNLRLAPEVLEITPQGKIRAAWVGGIDSDTFRQMAATLGAGSRLQSLNAQGDSK